MHLPGYLSDPRKRQMPQKKILVIGSSGQIGTELVEGLRSRFGDENVVASDIKEPQVEQTGPFAMVNAMDRRGIERIIEKYEITEVYLLAALLSATAEKDPAFAWQLNMESLFIVLELAREGKLKKVYWPSSIAVFGPTTPKDGTPQHTIAEPSTVYGISKQAGEQWCAYYHKRYGVDVRSIRYPGLIPVDYSAPEWIKTITYYSMDITGKADWIGDRASDIPVVGTSLAQDETAVQMAGIGYDYGLEEVNQALGSRDPLQGSAWGHGLIGPLNSVVP